MDREMWFRIWQAARRALSGAHLDLAVCEVRRAANDEYQHRLLDVRLAERLEEEAAGMWLRAASE